MSRTFVLCAGFLATLFSLQLASGAMFYGLVEEKPGFSDQCYYQHDGDQITFFPVGGTTYDTEKCIRYSCTRYDDGKLVISGAGCGVVQVAPPCKLTERTQGRYPDCCPKPDCPEKGVDRNTI